MLVFSLLLSWFGEFNAWRTLFTASEQTHRMSSKDGGVPPPPVPGPR